jgi:hypothetical protein
MRLTAVIAVLVGYFTVASILLAQKRNALTDRLIDAATPSEAGALCCEVFGYNIHDTHGLTELVSSESPTVALQASWRLHSRELPPRQISFGISPIVLYKPDVQRFVGFVEGRLRVQIPTWWEEMLESPDKLHPLRTGAKTASVLEFNETAIGTSSDLVHCKLDRRQVLVPASTLDWLAEVACTRTFHASVSKSGLVIVSIQSVFDGGKRSGIAYVDLESGEELWRHHVWGTNPYRFGSSGPALVRIDAVSIRVDRDQVTVFGAGSDWCEYANGGAYLNAALYVEQFSVRDGHSTVRFSTNNWGVRPDSIQLKDESPP